MLVVESFGPVGPRDTAFYPNGAMRCTRVAASNTFSGALLLKARFQLGIPLFVRLESTEYALAEVQLFALHHFRSCIIL